MYLEKNRKKFMPPHEWDNHVANAIVILVKDLHDSQIKCDYSIGHMIAILYKRSEISPCQFPRMIRKCMDKADKNGEGQVFRTLRKLLD